MEADLKLLETLEENNLAELVDILNNGTKLALYSGDRKECVSVDDFAPCTMKWAIDNKAEIFAILTAGRAIGLISLSHINGKHKTARIGYWLGSEHWNKGYATSAFGKILVIAGEKGIKTVSGSILIKNAHSKAIWKKFGAKFEEINGRTMSHIEIKYA